MPYKIIGNKVVKKNSGKVVGKSNHPKAYLAVLNMVEHGMTPRKKKKRK